MNRSGRLYYPVFKKSLCLLAILFLSVLAAKGKALTSGIDSGDECATVKPYLVREFDLEGPGILKAFTISGDIEVQPVAESNKVRVELYIERGYAIWSDSKNLDNYRINVLQRGNEIIASVEHKTKDSGFFSDRITFSYKIYVPDTISTELKTLGGNVKLNGVRGDQQIKTSGGNIVLNNITGRVAAFTSGGIIDISGNRGTIFAQTHGGDIRIDKSEGEIRLKASGGNIISHQVAGSFIARAEGGNIRAHFTDVGQGINLETTAGDIHLNLPSELGYDLFAVGTHIDFDLKDGFVGERGDRRVEGKINDGGSPVNVQTSLGTITIKVR